MQVRAADKKTITDDLITDAMPLARISDAFGLMPEGESIRTVVIH